MARALNDDLTPLASRFGIRARRRVHTPIDGCWVGLGVKRLKQRTVSRPALKTSKPKRPGCAQGMSWAQPGRSFLHFPPCPVGQVFV